MLLVFLLSHTTMHGSLNIKLHAFFVWPVIFDHNVNIRADPGGRTIRGVVCCRWIAAIACSDPTDGMNIRTVCLLCGWRTQRRADHSFTGVLAGVCVCVCDLETSRVGAPYIYIYDIIRLRVKLTVCSVLEPSRWSNPWKAKVLVVVVVVFHTFRALRCTMCQFRWPRGHKHGSTVACLLGARFRIPLGTWLSVFRECCVLSEVSASGWSLVERSPTECVCVCVSECDRVQH